MGGLALRAQCDRARTGLTYLLTYLQYLYTRSPSPLPPGTHGTLPSTTTCMHDGYGLADGCHQWTYGLADGCHRRRALKAAGRVLCRADVRGGIYSCTGVSSSHCSDTKASTCSRHAAQTFSNATNPPSNKYVADAASTTPRVCPQILLLTCNAADCGGGPHNALPKERADIHRLVG